MHAIRENFVVLWDLQEGKQVTPKNAAENKILQSCIVYGRSRVADLVFVFVHTHVRLFVHLKPRDNIVNRKITDIANSEVKESVKLSSLPDLFGSLLLQRLVSALKGRTEWLHSSQGLGTLYTSG